MRSTRFWLLLVCLTASPVMAQDPPPPIGPYVLDLRGTVALFQKDQQLADSRSLSFNELKQLMNTSDGNLSVHARKLEEAHYVTCSKGFEGRVPKTVYALTPLGRKALERYLDHMEALIRATRER